MTGDLFFGSLPLPLYFAPESSATEAQIQRLLDHLRRRPCHTHELRRGGISHPAGRVQDLIKRGHTIATSRVATLDSDGFTHHAVALYTLVAEPESERF